MNKTHYYVQYQRGIKTFRYISETMSHDEAILFFDSCIDDGCAEVYLYTTRNTVKGEIIKQHSVLKAIINDMCDEMQLI